MLEYAAQSQVADNDAIERLTGVRCSTTQVGEYLKRVSFKRLKAGSLPAKADPAAQAAFQIKSCCPI